VSPAGAPARAGDGVLRAAGVTAVLLVLGSVLGFGRDLLLARLFGATAGTDAFLVAWTVPETAAPLLIEGAMAFLLIPLFSRAVERGEDVRRVAGATLPPVLGCLVAVTAVTAVGAPLVVDLLAPGLAERELAVRCTRITSVTVLMFGLTGYLGAALRAHRVFGPPAGVYVAYNTAIIAFLLLFHERTGVLAAALGVAAGSVLMAAAQGPGFARRVGLPRRVPPGAMLALGAFVPIAAFTLLRQAQVFVERFAASSLTAGSISHLNYAQKIAQVPMVLSLIVATVTFPALARGLAAGDTATARRQVSADLRLAGAVICCATAFLVVFADEIVALLLRHGAFTAADAAATASIMRVYALGLLGQTVVGVVCRVYYCTDRPGWYPAVAMLAGLAATACLATLPGAGTTGIAAANAAGISLAAVLLLAGLRRPPLSLAPGALSRALGRPIAATCAAAVAGWLARAALPALPALPPLLTLACGAAAVTLTFAVLTGAKEITTMLDLVSRGRT
jgi:putative peptidoglycan lipid II flippase